MNTEYSVKLINFPTACVVELIIENNRAHIKFNIEGQSSGNLHMSDDSLIVLRDVLNSLDLPSKIISVPKINELKGNTTGVCQLCGEPMPPGEEMFNYHGYSGDCPKVEKHSDTQDNVHAAYTEFCEEYRQFAGLYGPIHSISYVLPSVYNNQTSKIVVYARRPSDCKKIISCSTYMGIPVEIKYLGSLST